MTFPSKWRISTLGEVAKWGSGGTPTAGNSSYYHGDIPWAVIGDLNDSLVSRTAKFISHDGLRNSSAKLVEPGTLLIAMYGSIGKLGIAGIRMATNQAIAFANPDESKVSGKYLFWYLASQRDAFLSSGKGATQQNISQTLLKSWRIPVPPLEEQQRIVATLEDHLSRLDKALAEVGTVKKLLSEQWLSFISSLLDGLFSSGESGFQHWTVKTINELVESPKDIVDGPFGSNLKSSHYSKQGARVVRLQNIGYGSWVESEAFVPYEHAQTLQKHNVRKGDLLFASLMDLSPRACIAPELGEFAIVKSDCIRIRLANQEMANWILLATQTLKARFWAQNAVHGLGRGRLGLSAIRSFPVSIPPVTHLADLLDMAEEVRAQIQESEKACLEVEVKSLQLRRSLLQQAFSGRLV